MDSLQVVVVASPFASLSSLYEVDPEADVLLIVPPSNKRFAPWDEGHVNGINKATAAAAPSSRPGLRIKVSSKHLALASRVFRNKLQLGSTTAARQSDGRVHLQLIEGFDPKAVSIVMNVLHGRGSKVPKSVDLETLAQIALFVDRFQLLDAVDVYAERWISRLEGLLPDRYNRDLVLWIYISHVFRQADIFRAATKVAAAHSPGPIQPLGLPFRDKIIKHIDAQRQSLVDQALTTLHQSLDGLAAGAATCPSYCDSTLLGELIKALHRHRLVWPRPPKPFPGISFESIIEAVFDGLSFVRQGAQADFVSRGEDTSRVTVKSSVRPGWGKVGGEFPVTPDASPEPVVCRSGAFDVHECGALRVVSRLDGLEALGDGVAGLELESKLGYQLY
ncbi:hypothetical protein VTK56DRAFT_6116 [Thermocarpiscus australiensis]